MAVVVLVGWAGRTAGAGAGVAQPPAAHGCSHRANGGEAVGPGAGGLKVLLRSWFQAPVGRRVTRLISCRLGQCGGETNRSCGREVASRSHNRL